VIQTRLLLSLIGVLCLLVVFAGIGKMSWKRNSEIEVQAKLCASYFQYRETTTKTIDALEKSCWR
jgi:hypothetical protein